VTETEAPPPPNNNQLAVERTDLALIRNYLALERTLMAWIRTALSLIGFGYTAVKAVQAVRGQALEFRGPLGHVHGLRITENIGFIMVMIGTVAVSLALIQHYVMVKELAALGLKRRLSIAMMVAIVLSVLGIFCFSVLATEMSK
jgi:putative membrane protein